MYLSWNRFLVKADEFMMFAHNASATFGVRSYVSITGTQEYIYLAEMIAVSVMARRSGIEKGKRARLSK